MRLRRHAPDLLIPAATAIFLFLVVGEEREQEEISGGIHALGVALAIAQGAALHWRRRRPELVFALAALGSAAMLLIVPSLVLPVAGYVALWALAVNRPRRVSLVGLVALLAVASINYAVATFEDANFALALCVGVWALGDAARSRSAAVEEEGRRILGDEQARIARELHDVIAHSVSVIVVQAAAADDVFDKRPDQARAAIRSIEQSGRDALRELRRLLSAVRPGVAQDAMAPQPGLQRLDELAEPLRAAGLEVVVRREGRAAPLPPGLDLSAYRIVQEALTNTLRHAAAARAEVLVRFGDGALELDVRDDGTAPPATTTGGHGLIGMRERASLLGGTLDAGPLPGGGFRVHARLPLEDAA